MRSAAICLAVAILASCSTTFTSRQDPAPSASTAKIGLGVLLGGSEVSDENDLFSAGGGYVGGRFDVTGRPSAETPIEFGVRTGFGLADVDYNDLPPGASASLEGAQFVLAPMVRFNFEADDATVVPFLEAAVGFQRTAFTETLSAGGLTLVGEDSDAGLWYAIGAGIAVQTSESGELVLGAEYAHSEFQDAEATADAYLAQIGFRFRF